MRFRYKLLIFVLLVIAAFIGLFLGYPRGASMLFSYKKECKVMRVEPFMKGMIMNGQAQKFSIICDDGFVCRAEDTGFAGVKTGDVVEFRGFPEFATFEEFGKCDHAQLNRIKVAAAPGVDANTIAPTNIPVANPPVMAAPTSNPPATLPKAVPGMAPNAAH